MRLSELLRFLTDSSSFYPPKITQHVVYILYHYVYIVYITVVLVHFRPILDFFLKRHCPKKIEEYCCMTAFFSPFYLQFGLFFAIFEHFIT